MTSSVEAENGKAGGALSAKDRRDRVLAEVYEKGRVTVNDMAERLGVSKATVRRDLNELASGGHLELFYGGATLLRPSDFSFRSKSQRNLDAKRVIGQLASARVKDGDLIFVDSGTTCFEMVPHLKLKRGLSVVVNSARLALELDAPGVNVILIGGQYRPDRMDTVGSLAAATLEQLRGYVAFIGADGLSREFGPAAGDIEAAHINRLALANAREGILVADHSKFQAPSLFKISEWDRISHIVTDLPPSPDWMDFLSERKITIEFPSDATAAQDNTTQREETR